MDSQVFYGPRAASELDAITGVKTGIAGFRFYNTSAVAYAAAGTSTVPVLYNPVNSGVVARIMCVRIGSVAGTVVQGALGYGWAVNATLTSVTAGPNPIPAYLGGIQAACGLLWYTTATSGAAPTFMPMGVNTGGAYAAGPTFPIRDDINGFLVLAPGSAFYPIVSINAVAMTALCAVDVIQTALPAGS